MTLKKIGVGGFASNTGKTTLVCELLRAFPGWEAIKVTRGHYRSCGKDAHACCVSHLLSDEPLVLSERARTDAAGKDTGRYWEAGASDVHWVVATDRQVERGIKEALGRVASRGVMKALFPQFVVASRDGRQRAPENEPRPGSRCEGRRALPSLPREATESPHSGGGGLLGRQVRAPTAALHERYLAGLIEAILERTRKRRRGEGVAAEIALSRRF